jgi:hypothetical protein
MDAADSADVDSPYFANNPKFWSGSKTLHSKVPGFLWHGGGESDEVCSQLYLGMTDERTTKGGGLWISAFMHNLLLEEQRRRNRSGGKYGLPPVIYIQIDSGSEFKNYDFMSFVELLNKSSFFPKIKVSFLPAGHTHEDIDAAFGRNAMAFNKFGEVVHNLAECALAAQMATKLTYPKINVYTVSVECLLDS